MKNQKTSQIEKRLLSEIEVGKYQNCYLIYNRKSTDEANNQKNSISYQKAENARFAKRERCSVAPVTLLGFCTGGVVSEKHSGFKEGDDLVISDEGMVQYSIDRPKFQRMVQLVNAGYFKGIVCLCWDRISRNKGDDTVIRKLMRRGIDIRFVYANYDRGSAGELHMDIDGMFAQHHSRVTSEKVTLTIRNSRLKGKCTYRAPIGYLNEGNMDYKPHDPDRAPIIKEMFELYATDRWSLSDIARHANLEGFKTLPMRRPRTREEISLEDDDEVAIEKVSRPVTENHISRILKNRFYTGRVLGPNGDYIWSTAHESLVTDELFDRVQSLLGKKKVSVHYTQKLDYPLRGVIRCARCARVYTPYEKKGILYFNARCLKNCTNRMKNCNFDFASKAIRGLIGNLHFGEEELSELDARISTDLPLVKENRAKEVATIERKKKTVRNELAYLRTNRLQLLTSGAYTPEGIVKEQQRLEAQISEFQEKESISDEMMCEMLQDAISFSELLKEALNTYDAANPSEKDQLARAIFSELYLAHDTLECKVKEGLEPFVNRSSAFSEPTVWLSELLGYREAFQRTLKLLQHIQNTNEQSPTNLAT